MAADVRLTLGPDGQITIPSAVLKHYGLVPEVSLRIVETTSGILLVPDRNGQVEEALAAELAGWQSLFGEALDLFDYEDHDAREASDKA